MSSKPHLLILSFTDARCDPRVFRQAQYLREEYTVTVAALANPKLEGVNFLPIKHNPAKGKLHRLWRAATLVCGWSAPFLSRFSLAQAEKQESLPRFDIVLINDDEPLALGFELANGAPVVFDAHEYYPMEYEDWFWKLFYKRHHTRLCHKYIPRCSGMTTVCPGLAAAYKEHFGRLPNIVYNAPEYHDLSATPVQPDRIRLIHHGAASPDRCIEFMIEMMRYVDARFTLDLMLVGNEEYLNELKRTSEKMANIYWREPVPMPNICNTINQYDMGLYILNPSSFNNTDALPNKFFEFIQARLGIAIGPSPEMAKIVQDHGLGVIANDFSPQSLAARLNALTIEDITRFKKNADLTAKLYNAQACMAILKNTLLQALQR